MEEQFSICDHPLSASLPPSRRAHHTRRVKWDSRALQEEKPRVLIQRITWDGEADKELIVSTGWGQLEVEEEIQFELVLMKGML